MVELLRPPRPLGATTKTLRSPGLPVPIARSPIGPCLPTTSADCSLTLRHTLCTLQPPRGPWSRPGPDAPSASSPASRSRDAALHMPRSGAGTRRLSQGRVRPSQSTRLRQGILVPRAPAPALQHLESRRSSIHTSCPFIPRSRWEAPRLQSHENSNVPFCIGVNLISASFPAEP